MIAGAVILVFNYFLIFPLFFYYLPHYRACKFLSAQSPVFKGLVEITKREKVFLEIINSTGGYFQVMTDGKKRIILGVYRLNEIKKTPRSSSFYQDFVLMDLEFIFAHELGHYFDSFKPGVNCYYYHPKQDCAYQEINAHEGAINILTPFWNKYCGTEIKKNVSRLVLIRRLESILEGVLKTEAFLCGEAIQKNLCPKSGEIFEKIEIFKKKLNFYLFDKNF